MLFGNLETAIKFVQRALRFHPEIHVSSYPRLTEMLERRMHDDKLASKGMRAEDLTRQKWP